MSAGSSKIFLLGTWGLMKVLIRFNPYLAHKHTLIRKGLFPNFYSIRHILTDIFDNKFAIETVVHIFGI